MVVNDSWGNLISRGSVSTTISTSHGTSGISGVVDSVTSVGKVSVVEVFVIVVTDGTIRGVTLNF